MTSDNPDNHYPDYISDNPEPDVTSVAVEVGGVVHLARLMQLFDEFAHGWARFG